METKSVTSTWKIFFGVTEIISALLEQGDEEAAKNILLEKDYDLEDLENFINQHPVSSDDLKEFISGLIENSEEETFW